MIAMSQNQKKRTRTLVDLQVQLGLVRHLAVHWIVFFLVNTCALVIWTRLFQRPDLTWGESIAETGRQFFPFFVVTAALIPVFAWDSLKLSHRFAGPISRLRRTLLDIKAGRAVAPLKFRETDFWQEIASDFNEVMELDAASQQSDRKTVPAWVDTEPNSPSVDESQPVAAETKKGDGVDAASPSASQSPVVIPRLTTPSVTTNEAGHV